MTTPTPETQKSRSLEPVERTAIELGLEAYAREISTQLDRAGSGDAVSATNLTPAARSVLERAAAEAEQLLEEIRAAGRIVVEKAGARAPSTS